MFDPLDLMYCWLWYIFIAPDISIVAVVIHDDIIKWNHFLHYWRFVWKIHGSRWIPRTKASDVEFWCFLWSAPEYSIKDWVNNREPGDLRGHRGHYDVNVMFQCFMWIRRQPMQYQCQFNPWKWGLNCVHKQANHSFLKFIDMSNKTGLHA